MITKTEAEAKVGLALKNAVILLEKDVDARLKHWAGTTIEVPVSVWPTEAVKAIEERYSAEGWTVIKEWVEHRVVALWFS